MNDDTAPHSESYLEAAIEGEAKIVAGALRSERNNSLNRAAYNLATLGISEQRIYVELLSAAKQCGLVKDDGIKSVEKTIASGVKAGFADPRPSSVHSHTKCKNVRRVQQKDSSVHANHDDNFPSPPSSQRSDENSQEAKTTRWDFPTRTPPDPNGRPKFVIAGEDGPPKRDNELRRHVYHRDGIPVRIKVKYQIQGKSKWANWYRVSDAGRLGWQSGKPEGYIDVPYFTHGLNPFDPVVLNEKLHWTEGEKDCDTVTRLGFLAFTFGGTGDGMPANAAGYLARRHVVIHTDNDEGGRGHAQRKAQIAYPIAASVKIIEFAELPEHGDVSDFIELLGTPEKLQALVDEAPEWTPNEQQDKHNADTAESARHTACLSDAQDTRPPEFTDEALAVRFAEIYEPNLRYVAAMGRWLLFDGKRWRSDDTLRAFDRAREICRKAAAECNRDRLAQALASAKTVAAVVTLARADRRLAATVDQWDAGPWLLNTPGGVVDLRTGQSRPHRPEDYMTKITETTPNASCPTPVWSQFLDRITNNDTDLIAFLQRMLGYALTGITREHALFFLYGTGANGKTTLLNTAIKCLGDYHRTAPIETFTESRQERHPTELAGLRGARLVSATETQEGRRWDESKIKALTGGDKIAARFMRQDFFEFTPQFKLAIAGNHKPGLRSVDEAIRRRLNLIPFTVTIPPEERDTQLEDKLHVELPGILASMIEGCLAWQREGLNPPEAVRSATEDYLAAEDVLTGWIEERCERDKAAWQSSSSLFGDWKNWAEKAGEYVGTQKRFAEQLKKKYDVWPKKNYGLRGFLGLRLKPLAPN
jgi:putative DNA primase/helicase